MKETYTQEEVDSIKMQIQEDIITYLDGMDDEIIDDVCQIVVNNFNIGQEHDKQRKKTNQSRIVLPNSCGN